MPLRFSDAATSILTSSITTTATSIVLESVASFPQNMVVGDYFICVIANTENTVRETVKVTAINYATRTLTIQRGYDSTTPVAWTIGSKVEIRGGSSFFKEVMLATMEMVYPVGSIYTNAGVSTNPSTLLGFGTWMAYASGRVLVGVNPTDPSFDQLEEIGGSKDSIVVSHTHNATSSVSDPGHTHTLTSGNPTGGFPYQSVANNSTNVVNQPTSTAFTGITVSTSVASTGSSGTNANLPPYITVYMWKRTA
jgi:hypothetical protein